MKKEKIKIVELLIHLAIITVLVLATVRPIEAQGSSPSATHSTSPSTMSSGSNGSGQAEATASTYQLPYAGLLPDHPLYFIKELRDTIIDLLIADTLKKADFMLLRADKHMAAGVALVDKGKPELAYRTVRKGKNYLSSSIELTDKAQKEGKEISSPKVKLKAALKKHEEALLALGEKTSGSAKDQFFGIAKEIGEIRKSL